MIKSGMLLKPHNHIMCLTLMLLFLGGCAKMAHLQELLTLKDLSDNQTQQTRYIEEQDKKFVKLLEAVNADQLPQYPHQKSVLRAFGEPILRKKMSDSSEQWLYRYSAKLFNSEKVCIYFDREEQLTRFEHILPETKKPSDT